MNTARVYRMNLISRVTVLLWLGVLLVLAVSLVSAQEEANPPLTDKAAEQFIDRFDDLVNEHKPDLVNTIFADDFVSHLPDAPALDRDGWAAYQGSLRASVLGATQHTHHYTRSGNRLVLYVTVSGLSSMSSIQAFRFDEDGLAVEHWAILDLTGINGPAWDIAAQLRK